MAEIYQEWQYDVETRYEDNRLAWCSVAFYRPHESGWYDEVRYDSHEWKKGVNILAPHLHMKIRCAFKDSVDEGVEELKSIIDNYVKVLKETVK